MDKKNTSFISLDGDINRDKLMEYIRDLNKYDPSFLKKVQELHLLDMASKDMFTGLYNRVAGEKIVDDALKAGKKGMVCLVDIDEFKRINDTYGHPVGDAVLREISTCLKNCFENEVVVRFGGDEFLIFDESVENKKKAEEKVKYFSNAISKIKIDQLDESFSVSAGLVFFESGEYASCAEVYKVADVLMYANKGDKKSNQLTMYREMSDEMPGALLIYKDNAAEEIVFASKGLIKLFDCETLDEFMEYTKGSFRNIVHPDELARVEDEIKNQIRDNQETMLDYVEYTIVSAKGKKKKVYDYGHLVDSQEYGSAYFVILTERQSEELFNWNKREELLDTPVVQILKSLSQKLVSVTFFNVDDDAFINIKSSPKFEKALEGITSVRAAFQKNIDVLMKPEARDEAKEFYNLDTLSERMGDKEMISFEYEGSLRGWCKGSFIPVTRHENGDVKTALYTVRYINEERTRELNQSKIIDSLVEEEKRRADELQDALRLAEKASRSKTDFLSRMSHDIRTPMNGIIGMTHIMRKQIDDKDKVLEALDKVDKLSQQLQTMINDVLEMSRIESGKVTVSTVTFDLNDTLQEINPAIVTLADGKDVMLAGSHYDVKHTSLIGAPNCLQRIIMNIFSNAIKYNRPGGTIECWLKETELDDRHSNYTFTIKDTGIGMSEEFINHIFEPFSRESDKFHGSPIGTGLGMAITKELIDKMDGTIEVQSKLGEGSTFIINLPFELTDELVSEKVEKEDSTLDGMKILLVDDAEINREVAEFMLTDAGAIVDTASNGVEAIEKFANHMPGTYDIILMDVMMPRMNGLDATKALRILSREDAKTIPILAMTANAFEEDIKKCLEAGMNDHIAKPIAPKNMIEKILKFKK